MYTVHDPKKTSSLLLTVLKRVLLCNSYFIVLPHQRQCYLNLVRLVNVCSPIHLDNETLGKSDWSSTTKSSRSRSIIFIGHFGP